MGLMDKFKNFVNPSDMDENYEDDYTYDVGGDNADYNNGGYADEYNAPAAQQQNAPYQNNGYAQNAPQRRGAPNAGMQQTSNNMALSGNALELKIVRPERWENVNQIADHLINHRTVVLSLESTNKETARRMIDFLLGVVYTIDGDIKNVDHNMWVITPNNVDMQDMQRKPKNKNNMDNFDEV